MKTKLVLFLSCILSCAHTATAQGTIFSYQGRLADNGAPANGNYGMVFYLCDTPAIGGQLANLGIVNVPVSNGLFTVTLDFGANFPGAERWLEITVKTNGAATFTTLSPRQKLLPTPYAIHAGNATLLSGLGTNALAPAIGSSFYVAKSGDTMTGTLNLPADGFVAGGSQLVLSGGKVGIGMTSPAKALDVAGDIRVDNLNSIGWWNSAFSGGSGLGHYASRIAKSDASYAGNMEFYVRYPGDNAETRAMTISSLASGVGQVVVNGNVGIGTTSPGASLDVIGWMRVNSSGPPYPDRLGLELGVHNGSLPAYSWIQSHESRPLALNPLGNNVGIGTTTPSAKLEVNGSFKVTGAGNSVTTPVLTITGGADVAEPFQMSGSDIPKGAVVVIDEENAGHLKMSERAYDTRVAGIVSGAGGVQPGITLSQQGVLEGGQHVSLSGRVYVQADATDAPIKPGDLLTTSATPGHAMKVTDHAKSQGAILGKAMSPLKEGKGLVLVLVTLQ